MPIIFSQTPLEQIPLVLEHSSMSLQDCLSGDNSCPSGHWHLYDPSVFTHKPPRHNPGVSSHSSISLKNIYIVDEAYETWNVCRLTHANLHWSHCSITLIAFAYKISRDIFTYTISAYIGCSYAAFVNIFRGKNFKVT